MYAPDQIQVADCGRPLIDLCFPPQIDLESSEDDIQEIQQEISVLATCASAFVTQYKASFLKGHKLWIVMEYLGGGSCLDLVRGISLLGGQPNLNR